MPLKKKLVKLGIHSRAVIIPWDWIKYFEEQTGKKLTHVTLDINDKIMITPYFEPTLYEKYKYKLRKPGDNDSLDFMPDEKGDLKQDAKGTNKD